MILNCAIIDEDPEALALLKHYVEETPSLNLIGAYHNAIEAVDGIHHNHLDILFLAIHMQQISGLEFAKLVPMNVKIIFTTAFKEYAIEAYKVNAFDQTVRGMQYQGKSVTEAQNMAAMSTKGKVQVQATLVSIKAWMIIPMVAEPGC